MLLENITVTKEDFDQCEWQNIFFNSDKRECDAYLSLLVKKAEEAQEQGNTKCQEVFALLYHICSLMLDLDSDSKPFRPVMELVDRRSAAIDDFKETHLETLEKIVNDVKDAELRARIADVLWCRRRGGYSIAKLAVDSYLESAQVLEDPMEWVWYAQRVERATQIAASLGKQNKSFADVIGHIENTLNKYQGEDPLFLSAKLMEILQEHRHGNPSAYAKLAEKAALRAEATSDPANWHRARTYWQIKSRWHSMEGDEESRKAALIQVAETYVKESEDALKREYNPYSSAAHFLQQAIEALRQIAGTQERQKDLHRTLIEYQRKSMAELGRFSESVDISQAVKNTVDIIKGKSIRDALFTLALSGSSPRITDLRDMVKGIANRFSLSYFMPAQMLNKEGRVVGHRDSMYEEGSLLEEPLRSEMLRVAVLQQNLHAQAIVSTGITQINTEHNVRIGDFLPILTNNPFVPAGREIIFARGLHAGLTGDLLVAAHLLIPQLEHSIRYLLYQKGTIPSGLDAQGIQDEYPLNKILYKFKQELTEVFGEDLLFDLQGLLIERFGSNLRNLLAHGLLDYIDFHSTQFLYLWWLTLRLCCLPIYTQIYAPRANSSLIYGMA